LTHKLIRIDVIGLIFYFSESIGSSMRLIPIIVLACLLSFESFAQFHSSPVQPIEYVKNVLAVGELNGDLYTVVKHKKEEKLQVYSTQDLTLKRELVLDMRKDGRFRVLETAFLFDSGFVYITSYANLTTEKRVVELFKVVGDSVLPPIEIAELSMKNMPLGPWREYVLVVDCLVSPDGKSLAITYQNQQDMSSVNNRTIVVFDEDFEPVSVLATIVNFPANQSKIRFNLKDQLLLLDGGTVVQKTLMGVVVYTLSDQFSVFLPKPSSNYCVRSFGGGRLVISGLYSYSEGGFMIIVYGDKYSRVIRQEFDFADAYRFQVMDLLVKENREVTLVVEEIVRKQVWRTGIRYGQPQPASHSAPVKPSSTEFGDIYLINFSPNGNKTWQFKLGKEEIDSDPTEFSSLVFGDGNGVYIVYNGLNLLSEAGEGASGSVIQPMVCMVKEDGIAVKTPIFSTEQSSDLIPIKCAHFNKGCFLLTSDFFCFFGK